MYSKYVGKVGLVLDFRLLPLIAESRQRNLHPRIQLFANLLRLNSFPNSISLTVFH
jgi:hypothetical protein